MKKINEFHTNSLSSLQSEKVYGGLKDIATKLTNANNEVLYTDVHHDMDNDGKWSPGDSFSLTMA